MQMMRPLCLAALLMAAPAALADERGPSDGLEQLQEGTRQLLRDLMRELEPGLRELQRRLGDLPAYHPPEVLPNGDILIRRRTAPEPEPTPEDDGIEL